MHFGLNTAAVQLCADIGRPSHELMAAERRANTYLVSTFVIPSEFDGTQLNWGVTWESEA